MSTLQVISPKFDSEKKQYIFEFNNAPKITKTTANPSRLEITNDEINEIFIKDFLKQASKYFSKPLESSLFFRRVVYEWNTNEIDIEEVGEESETFRATWIPAKIIIATNRYELHFNLVELEPILPTPSIGTSGFLEEIQPQSVDIHFPDLPITEVHQEAIPFADPSPEERTRRERERRHIRQTRLRATLTKLRAERMAERYYARYNNFEFENSESELTSDSELDGLP